MRRTTIDFCWLRHAILVVICLGAALPESSILRGEDPASVAFFESRIRPVLVEHCYSCHSSEARQAGDLQAGLLVDSSAGLLSGGDSGPALVPGKPEESLLFAAMRYEDFEMPPSGPLDTAILDDFQQWIQAGAVDPREAVGSLPAQTGVDREAARQHWAYQPVPEVVDIPQVAEQTHVRRPIDAFIVAKWPAGTKPAPAADRATLARRLYFDLTGLPPTADELADFLHDERPDAYRRLVDRLLSSPQFGPHWGRHWLDVARYAESVTLRGLVQHAAWRYRDYVIDSYNFDLPYGQFVKEQIAGDLLTAETLAERRRQAIATGFLTLGNHNLEDQDKEKLNMDAVDEQLRVIGSAMLGQTLGCARCHDHKFDPISTREYYALAGILRNVQSFEHANVSRWVEKPLPLDAVQAAELEAHQQEVAELNRQIGDLERQLEPVAKRAKSVPAGQLEGIVLDDETAELMGQWQSSEHSPRFVGPRYLHDDNADQGNKWAKFQYQLPSDGSYRVQVSYPPGANRSKRVPITVRDHQQEHQLTINQQQTPPIEGLFVELGTFQFVTGQAAEILISNTGATGHVVVDAVRFLPVDESSSGNKVAGEQEPTVDAAATAKLRSQLDGLRERLKKLQASGPQEPVYMGVRELGEIKDLQVQIRGNVHRHGELAPRGVLSVAQGEHDCVMPEDASGRLQLGEWLSDPGNPLTARVYVNRVWGWLCGEWLVRSPDNFGTTGMTPTHPELLDYLTRVFIDNGWSTKYLIREIVLSDMYQRDSRAAEALFALDPGNTLWLRAMPKRLTAESILDAMQAVSGNLDRSMGGKLFPDNLSADYDFRHNSTRRVVYWPAFRNSQPEILGVFNGANPSLVTGRRDQSTVAPQALFMMNSGRVLALSQQYAQQLACAPVVDVHERVVLAYQTILGRPPTDEERSIVSRYVMESHDEPVAAWTDVVHSLFCAMDFQYLR